MTEHYDSGDLDAIRDFRRSKGFELFSKRLSVELERRRRELELEGKGDYERGQVYALRVAMAIPENLEIEIKSQVTE